MLPIQFNNNPINYIESNASSVSNNSETKNLTQIFNLALLTPMEEQENLNLSSLKRKQEDIEEKGEKEKVEAAPLLERNLKKIKSQQEEPKERSMFIEQIPSEIKGQIIENLKSFSDLKNLRSVCTETKKFADELLINSLLSKYKQFFICIDSEFHYIEPQIGSYFIRDHQISSNDTEITYETLKKEIDTVLIFLYKICKKPILHFYNLHSLKSLEMYANFLTEEKVIFQPISLLFNEMTEEEEDIQDYERRLGPFLTDALKTLSFEYGNGLSLEEGDYIRQALCNTKLPGLRQLDLSEFYGDSPKYGDSTLTGAEALQITELAPNVAKLKFNEFTISGEFLKELENIGKNIESLNFTNCFVDRDSAPERSFANFMSSEELSNLEYITFPPGEKGQIAHVIAAVEAMGANESLKNLKSITINDKEKRTALVSALVTALILNKDTFINLKYLDIDHDADISKNSLALLRKTFPNLEIIF